MCAALVWIAVLALVLPRDAHAYIDPGTGSYLLQAALAALMGALVALKTYWHRVKAFFSRSPAPEPSRRDPADPEQK